VDEPLGNEEAGRPKVNSVVDGICAVINVHSSMPSHWKHTFFQSFVMHPKTIIRPLQYFDIVTCSATEDKSVLTTRFFFTIVGDNIAKPINGFTNVGRSTNKRGAELGRRGKYESVVPIQ
tara:strand:- start:10659 stop:11018 length:360 start_codon:yes stop_codon:yes gene_type:complete